MGSGSPVLFPVQSFAFTIANPTNWAGEGSAQASDLSLALEQGIDGAALYEDMLKGTSYATAKLFLPSATGGKGDELLVLGPARTSSFSTSLHGDNVTIAGEKFEFKVSGSVATFEKGLAGSCPTGCACKPVDFGTFVASTDPTYLPLKPAVPIDDLTFGGAVSISIGGGGATKPNISDVKASGPLGSAATCIFQAVSSGDMYDSITFAVAEPGSAPSSKTYESELRGTCANNLTALTIKGDAKGVRMQFDASLGAFRYTRTEPQAGGGTKKIEVLWSQVLNKPADTCL